MSHDPSDAPGMHEAARREKLRQLEQLGVDPWGHRFDDHTAIGKIRDRESEITSDDPPAGGEHKGPVLHGPKVRAAGRVVLMRKTGKLIFLNLRDWSGTIQIFIGKKQVGDDGW